MAGTRTVDAMALSLQDYRLWRRRIEDCQALQAHQHPRWQSSLNLFSMEYWRSLGYTGSWEDEMVPVNYATTFVSTLLAATFARNPKMFVRARSPRFARFSETMEQVLERHWDEANIKEIFLSVILDAIIFGIGWAECGFLPFTGEALPSPEPSQNGASLFGRLFGKSENLPVETGILEEQKQRGEFYCLRRSPYDILVPPGFSDYWSMPYLIVHERLMVEDFFANPTYHAKERIGKGKPIPREENGANLVGPKYTFGGGHDAEKIDGSVVDLFTPWDRRSQSVFTISKESDEAHRLPADWPNFSEGFPQMPLLFNRVPNSRLEANFYPFGSLEPIFAQILEKSKIRTQGAEHRRRANIVVFAQKGSQTEEELRNYTGATGAVEVVPVTNIQAIQVAPSIPIPPAVFDMERMVNSDLDRDSQLQLMLADLARVGQIERATVANIAQSNANLGSGFKVDRVESFAKQVSRYQMGLFWQHMSRFDVGDLIGTLPDEEQWPSLPEDMAVARQRIRRELELRVEAGSTRPIQDDVLDREQFIRASAVFQQISPLLFKRIERPWMAEMVKRFRIPSLEAMILQATDEREAEIAMQENRFMLEGMLQVVGECEDHETHLKVHAQMQQHQIVAAHMQAHQIKLQELTSGQRTAGQGVRQSAASPSAAEVGRMGTPSFSDVSGQAMNLRQGTGGAPLSL